MFKDFPCHACQSEYSSPTKKPHQQLIHFNITSGQSSHVDTTLPSLVGPSTKTQRRSASLKPASRVPRFGFSSHRGGHQPATPHPVTWPQEAGSKYWPWHPTKTNHFFTTSTRNLTILATPKKNICGKD